MSSPPYSLQSVAKLAPIIKERAQILANRLAAGASASPSGTVDAYKLFGLFSLEIVCQVGFAKRFDDDSVEGDAFKLLQAMDGAAPTLIFDGILPFLRPLRLGHRMPGAIGEAYRCHAYWTEKSYEMVDHFLKHSTMDDKYLLTPLIKQKDGFLERKLNHEELVEEAMNYMFAGSGTTSSTLTYLIYELSRPQNATIQSRLRDEVIAISSDDIVGIRSNAYVNAVVKETFRLHPTIISTIPRLVGAPLQLGRHTIPAGTVVGMQNWIHHRDPAVFPDPDHFIPDRWLDATEAMESSLTPFSIGRRGCIGQNLAWEEIYWVITALFHSGLEVRLEPEMKEGDMEMVDRFNIAPRAGKLMVEVARVHPSTF
ncbi:hypothetical protein CkaCkLH20_12984 [Colletotrichum karsti]|uniref:Cytochrome P450 n=1 Tax=Colletotrichum karsti TaxID=1095194 RepID=A0A9P6HVH3_9PEZI|nr:uncharacterized protein CkaCkLH20_12984 [Colletotrichum karsti]KAF9869591.1 hypothetical protein CkaCkLH20_12984 [Colletotrichum karsti]